LCSNLTACRQIWTGSVDATLNVWDPKTQRQVKALKHGSQRICALHVSNKVVWAASIDRTLAIWDAKVSANSPPLTMQTYKEIATPVVKVPHPVSPPPL
jgi:WD40 repeat protein